MLYSSTRRPNITSTVWLLAQVHTKRPQPKLTNDLPDDTSNHEICADVTDARSRIRRGSERSTRTLHNQRGDIASDEDIRVPTWPESAPLLTKLDDDMFERKINTSSQKGRRKDDYPQLLADVSSKVKRA
jgi:hypothetical protein